MRIKQPNRTKVIDILLMLGVGFLGGIIAYLLSLPMPFFVGGLIFTAFATLLHTKKYERKIQFPQTFRWSCMALIGVMIGASFDESILQQLSGLWVSLIAMVMFVLLIQQLGYFYFRHIGKYDQPTATYSAMPGGLIESIVLGVQAGGDVRILSVHHFSRVILVAVSIPIGFYLWSGETVGSAAGENFTTTASTFKDFIFIFLLAAGGGILGKLFRFPVYHILGPLIVSVAFHAFGWLNISTPGWLLAFAQLIIGVSLGVTFSGITLKVIFRSFLLSIGFVYCALIIGFVFAYFVSNFFQIPIEELFICFAIGGLIEMGLIAISLGINPVFVAAHHFCRIIITIFVARLFSHRFEKRNRNFTSKEI